VLSPRTLLFLGDFDGDFGQLMSDLAKSAGPVFDAILAHVDAPPTTPVADNMEAFVAPLSLAQKPVSNRRRRSKLKSEDPL
jgi:hypothetical protein